MPIHLPEQLFGSSSIKQWAFRCLHSWWSCSSIGMLSLHSLLRQFRHWGFECVGWHRRIESGGQPARNSWWKWSIQVSGNCWLSEYKLGELGAYISGGITIRRPPTHIISAAHPTGAKHVLGITPFPTLGKEKGKIRSWVKACDGGCDELGRQGQAIKQLKTRRLSNNSALLSYILVCLLHTKTYGRYGERTETQIKCGNFPSAAFNWVDGWVSQLFPPCVRH